MLKTVIKKSCLVMMVLTWLALIGITVKLEDETMKVCSIIGLLGLTYLLLRLYCYIDMYQKCEKLYCDIKENDKKRIMSWYEGDAETVQDYIELIQIDGDEMLELSQKVVQTFPLLPKKKLIRMANRIENMMKREYPPI